MSCTCPIVKKDFKPAVEGNDHHAYVTTPKILGDITEAAIWVTIRDSAGSVVLRRRNEAAGGDDAEVMVIRAGDETHDGAFRVDFPAGTTTGMVGTFDVQIDIVVGDFDQTIVIGTWCITATLTDRSE